MNRISEVWKQAWKRRKYVTLHTKVEHNPNPKPGSNENSGCGSFHIVKPFLSPEKHYDDMRKAPEALPTNHASQVGAKE